MPPYRYTFGDGTPPQEAPGAVTVTLRGTDNVSVLAVDLATGARGSTRVPGPGRWQFAARAATLQPTLTGITPNQGPAAGGTVSRLRGHALRAPVRVYYGPAESPTVRLISSTEIEATAPANLTGGPVQVGAQVGTPPTGTNSVQFFYDDASGEPPVEQLAPVLGTVSPNRGPASGGTTVTVTGEHFGGATGLQIQNSLCDDFQVLDTETITATTPAGSTGPRRVIIKHPAGDVERANLFTYEAEE
jgi:IPT/TIG domain